MKLQNLKFIGKHECNWNYDKLADMSKQIHIELHPEAVSKLVCDEKLALIYSDLVNPLYKATSKKYRQAVKINNMTVTVISILGGLMEEETGSRYFFISFEDEGIGEVTQQQINVISEAITKVMDETFHVLLQEINQINKKFIKNFNCPLLTWEYVTVS